MIQDPEAWALCSTVSSLIAVAFRWSTWIYTDCTYIIYCAHPVYLHPFINACTFMKQVLVHFMCKGLRSDSYLRLSASVCHQQESGVSVEEIPFRLDYSSVQMDPGLTSQSWRLFGLVFAKVLWSQRSWKCSASAGSLSLTDGPQLYANLSQISAALSAVKCWSVLSASSRLFDLILWPESCTIIQNLGIMCSVLLKTSLSAVMTMNSE